MAVPLYTYDNEYRGLISDHSALKLERDGLAKAVRKRTGRVVRLVMYKRPGEPRPTTVRDHMGQAYSYRHDLDDGHQPWALRPLGHRIRTDQSFEYNLAPECVRTIFLRVLLECIAPAL